MIKMWALKFLTMNYLNLLKWHQFTKHNYVDDGTVIVRCSNMLNKWLELLYHALVVDYHKWFLEVEYSHITRSPLIFLYCVIQPKIWIKSLLNLCAPVWVTIGLCTTLNMLLRLRKPCESINTPGCEWAAETKMSIRSVPDPFRFTAINNALCCNST